MKVYERKKRERESGREQPLQDFYWEREKRGAARVGMVVGKG